MMLNSTHERKLAEATMETPNCAHIGKRMAMTARAALLGAE